MSRANREVPRRIQVTAPASRVPLWLAPVVLVAVGIPRSLSLLLRLGRLGLVAVGHRTRQESSASSHRHSLLEAQWAGVCRRIVDWWRTDVRRRRSVCEMRPVSRRGIQPREVDVRRRQLQCRRLVRSRRQSPTLATSRHQYRVTVLMRVMMMMVVVRMTRSPTSDGTRTARTLLETRRTVPTIVVHPMNRTR